jgi:hypothetical protein
LIVLQFDRHKRVLGDYIKRGYIKKYEDAFADLEKTAAALPADQADQFRGFFPPARAYLFHFRRRV